MPRLSGVSIHNPDAGIWQVGTDSLECWPQVIADNQPFRA
ncbi:hypothetical protein SXCC_02777 [Gluconacetobacter sp. SXCC-1]|nr:hypothetical protein SXCC_02777 [Gluconacetobacter sp. SXCC-1]